MAGIRWNPGPPPATKQGERLLLIASPLGRNFDAQADNRPAMYIGHFREGEPNPVSTRIWGMSENEARPELNVLYWADVETDLPMEIRALAQDDLKG